MRLGRGLLSFLFPAESSAGSKQQLPAKCNGHALTELPQLFLGIANVGKNIVAMQPDDIGTITQKDDDSCADTA